MKLGWFRLDTAFASRSNRCRDSGLAERAGGRTLMVTVWSRRVSRALYGAGVEMRQSNTSPALLADRIVGMLGANATCPRIPTDGAHRAAQHIVQLMERR